MAYLKFDKDQLINLEYSLSREIIRSNRGGTYGSTTIIGCNTRKYHGLLICPNTTRGSEKYVLLSTLDVSIIQHDQEFNLGIHKYQGDLFLPRGHKYVRNFGAETVTVTTYRVGGVVLERESILLSNSQQILIKYTLKEAQSDTYLRFKPFLAFRSIHELSKANMYANTKYQSIKNGIYSKLYHDLPGLYMQFNKPVEFVSGPDWYYNIEYMEEQKRGYDFKEDLFVPGYFECTIKKGETVVFSASTSEEVKPSTLKTKYTAEKKKRIPRDSYISCLKNAAEQFIIKTEGRTEITAGFPWFGSRGRDTFVALPGLTLITGSLKTARDVINTMISKMNGGLFPIIENNGFNAFHSVDTPLWFIYTLQQLFKYDKGINVWKTYKEPILQVLNAYRNGTDFNIHMLENGLIWAGEEGKPLTWMDALNSLGPVTPRRGMAVEINGLWYNAVCASLEWAEKAGDKKFVKEWKTLPEKIKLSFVELFWDEKKGYLADFVDGDYKDFSVRPNQVIVAAMDYSPIDKEIKRSVLSKVESELLTPKGLRTLSPQSDDYIGVCECNQEERESSYHQGTAWPWLLEFFVKAYLEVNKKSGLGLAKQIYYGFEEDMIVAGIGTVSEFYPGDPPHTPCGAISQAWSVAALLRIYEMIFEAEQEMMNQEQSNISGL